MSFRASLMRSAAALCFVLPLSFATHAAENDTEGNMLEIDIYPKKFEFETNPLSGLPALPERPGTLTVPSVTQTQREMARTPGAVTVVPTAKYQDTYAHNIEDVMDFTPGVFARKRYGAEVRLSVRGSGLSRGFHMRGLELLQDGIPFNLADGSADFQEVDPLIAQHIEVYKGGNGLRFGASSLGGAINFVMPTAYSADAQNLVRLEGGSFGSYRVHTQASRIYENTDVFAAMSANKVDGFRDHEKEESIRFSGNIGHRFNHEAETRFYLLSNVVDQELPGTITLQQALDTPEMAASNAVSGHHQRNVRSIRVANKTAVKLDNGGLFEFGGYAGYKRLYHPIFQVIDQRGPLAGLFTRYRDEGSLAGHRNILTVGGDLSWGEVDAKRFVNIAGSRGALTASGTQSSTNLRLYAENQFYALDDFALVGGVQAIHSYRKFTNDLVPAQSDATDFTSVSPKAGVLWDVTENAQLYANVTRSYEPPTFSELVQSVAFQFVPLDPQRAVTFEMGTRGATAFAAWDISLYRAQIRGEFINYWVSPFAPSAVFNADRTIHQGVEASLTLDIGTLTQQSVLPEGSRLLLEQAYTYSDFRFDGDPLYGNNKLAGMPPHVYVAALRYKSPAPNGLGWDIAPKLEWVKDGGYADYANTLKAPGYTIIGIDGGVDLSKGVRLFVDARNLTDKRYISTYTAITNPADPGVSPAIFYPGEGRSVFAGVRVAF